MSARDASRDRSRDPWRAVVSVAQISDTGLHREIEADEATRATMAEIAGLRDISSAHASFDLVPRSGGRVQVLGRVQAKVGQNCVVSLDPIESDIDEEVDLIFAPVEQIPQLAESADNDDPAAEVTDAPEPIENGVIDLGRLATDVLYLAIDPYPRKEGAVFEPPVTAADPEDHPFAALKSLQLDPGKPNGKPKGK
jgi:Large ribosomal RNA subunit accumulation protein YceD